jgi:heat-inducible transcriptional repressor
MADLTERQTKILKSIVEEYMESGEPVGSETLEKKYELGVSPATIRNEMVKLTEVGYLKQPHASAGRVPTKQAFKLYVSQLMEEKQLSVAEEVAAKEKIWDSRFDFDQLMHEAVKALAERTHALALAAVEEGNIYHAGYANILSMPEFYDIDVTRTVLSIIEEINEVRKLFEKSFGEGPIHLLLGDELGYEYLEPCGMVFTTFDAGPKKRGSLGIIGPNRLDYPRVVPLVRYFGDLVEELAANL